MGKQLALLGGTPEISDVPEELFHWPIITKEDEDAVLDVLHRGSMSALDVTSKFEEEFAVWQGRRYALAFCNGTLSLEAAMYACGVGYGDEIICPSKTYWGSCIQAFHLGATVVFADIEYNSLCIDPADIERCISEKTKAIMVVHYLAYPANMDEIMKIAERYNIPVIEDVSHAQGGLYKGKKLGTFGKAAAMSLMSGKSFATGEMGILVTDDREVYERAMSYSHYERSNSAYIKSEEIVKYAGVALGGMKGRANQFCSAIGRVQLKYYEERCREIDRAMKYFWSLLSGVPGIRPHAVDESDGSTMAGWYYPQGFYNEKELYGLPLGIFCKAVSAEGFYCAAGGNAPLHTYPVFKDADIYHEGKPTRIAHAFRDVRELDAPLHVCNEVKIFTVPWFKKYMPEQIEKYANAFKKAAENAETLAREANADGGGTGGSWFFYRGESKK